METKKNILTKEEILYKNEKTGHKSIGTDGYAFVVRELHIVPNEQESYDICGIYDIAVFATAEEASSFIAESYPSVDRIRNACFFDKRVFFIEHISLNMDYDIYVNGKIKANVSLQKLMELLEQTEASVTFTVFETAEEYAEVYKDEPTEDLFFPTCTVEIENIESITEEAKKYLEIEE